MKKKQTRWVVEGTLRAPTRTAVLDRVEGFEDNRFVPLHVGKVIPAVGRIESAVIHFADPVGINSRTWEEFLHADAARVGDGQRLSLLFFFEQKTAYEMEL